MSALRAPVKLGVPLREAISWVGVVAKRSGTESGAKAAEVALSLASSFGPETEITVDVPVDHILCQVCDRLREQGSLEEAAKVEQIVAFLKDGQHRMVRASLGFNVQNVNELDARYEDLRKRLTP